MQKMIASKHSMRCDPPEDFTYQDSVFANKMNHLIKQTDDHYKDGMYKNALKTGFYDLQVIIMRVGMQDT